LLPVTADKGEETLCSSKLASRMLPSLPQTPSDSEKRFRRFAKLQKLTVIFEGRRHEDVHIARCDNQAN
jgi:hypothetical protein